MLLTPGSPSPAPRRCELLAPSKSERGSFGNTLKNWRGSCSSKGRTGRCWRSLGVSCLPSRLSGLGSSPRAARSGQISSCLHPGL